MIPELLSKRDTKLDSQSHFEKKNRMNFIKRKKRLDYLLEMIEKKQCISTLFMLNVVF